MRTIKTRLSIALSAALLLCSVLAVPAGATHIAGLPHGGNGNGQEDGNGNGDGGGLLPDKLKQLPNGKDLPVLPDAPSAELPTDAVSTTDTRAPAEGPKPETQAKTSRPSGKRVVVERPVGRTSSAGNFRRGSVSNDKKHSPASQAVTREDTKNQDLAASQGSQPGRTTKASSDKAGSGGTGVGALTSRVIEGIPPQYRWPVFVLACIALLFALNTVRERFRSKRAEGRALTDSLTNLPNRMAFEQALAKEYKRADRYGRPLSMLLLDLDGFKEINDTFGHAAGDETLRKAAAAIAERIRSDDFAARLGGDEFVVLCPETSTVGAHQLALSLEECLEKVSIQASIGVAERELEDDGLPEYMVARADAAMYQRKQRSGAGRERRSGRVASVKPAAGLAGA